MGYSICVRGPRKDLALVVDLDDAGHLQSARELKLLVENAPLAVLPDCAEGRVSSSTESIDPTMTPLAFIERLITLWRVSSGLASLVHLPLSST